MNGHTLNKLFALLDHCGYEPRKPADGTLFPGKCAHVAVRRPADPALGALRPLVGARWLQAISACLPLTYGVDALRAVMLRGAGLLQMGFDLAVIRAFVAAFFALAQVGFREKRAKERQAGGLAHAD